MHTEELGPLPAAPEPLPRSSQRQRVTVAGPTDGGTAGGAPTAPSGEDLEPTDQGARRQQARSRQAQRPAWPPQQQAAPPHTPGPPGRRDSEWWGSQLPRAGSDTTPCLSALHGECDKLRAMGRTECSRPLWGTWYSDTPTSAAGVRESEVTSGPPPPTSPASSPAAVTWLSMGQAGPVPGSSRPCPAYLARQKARVGRAAAGQLPAAGPMNTQYPSSWAGSEAQATGSWPPSRQLQHASSRASQNWRHGGGPGGRPRPQGGASSRQKNQARKGWQRVCRRRPHACAAASTSSPCSCRRWLGSQACPMPRRLHTDRDAGRGRQRAGGPRGLAPSTESLAGLQESCPAG